VTVHGVGVGLRSPHLVELLETRPAVPFLEVVTDNFLDPGPVFDALLERVAEVYPLTFHGVRMNLGSTDPLDDAYLDRVAALADRYDATYVSDHLCWIGVGGCEVPDLLPLPYDEATLAHVVDRVKHAQDRLGRRLMVENASAYIGLSASTMPEWVFLSQLAERADCHLLLDVNNVFVNATNFGFDPQAYLHGLPKDRVAMLHMAGHEDWGGVLVDTHSRGVCDEVAAMYSHTIAELGPLPTVLEWDRDLPSLSELLAHARGIEALRGEVSAKAPR